jgi:hypothetical protein
MARPFDCSEITAEIDSGDRRFGKVPFFDSASTLRRLLSVHIITQVIDIKVFISQYPMNFEGRGWGCTFMPLNPDRKKPDFDSIRALSFHSDYDASITGHNYVKTI